MKPQRSILDKTFVYRNSVQTDLRETFERIRKEMAAKTQPTVTPIKRERKHVG